MASEQYRFWAFGSVALLSNVCLVFMIRPSSDAIGWGHNSAFAEIVETAPLAVLCLLTAIGPNKLTLRLCLFAAAIFSVATISAAHAVRGELVVPSFPMIEKISAELNLLLWPACFVIASGSAYGGFRLGPEELPAQRTPIRGMFLATSILAVVIAWNTRTDDNHLAILMTAFVIAPIYATLITLAAWCGQSNIRCAIPLLVAPSVAMSFTLAGLASNRLASFVMGVSVTLAWISLSVSCLRYAEWPLSRRRSKDQ